MGINNDVQTYFNEQNKRINKPNYNITFPILYAFQNVAAESGDPDYEEMIFDYSVTPGIYTIPTNSKSDIYINEIHITYSSLGVNCYPDRYGDIIGGLTNGLILALYQNGDYEFVSPAIKINRHYQRFFNGHVMLPDWKGECVITATLHLDVPVILRAGTTDFLAVQVSDDLSGLISHTAAVSGFQIRVIDLPTY